MRVIDKFARHGGHQGLCNVVRYYCSTSSLLPLCYINDNRHERRPADRDAMIQKIINVINLLEATPIAFRAKAIGAMSDPDLKASIS